MDEKKVKKRIIENIILIVILIALIVAGGIIYYKNYYNKSDEKKETITEEPKLTKIGYGSKIESVGYHESKGIMQDFIRSYNEHNGEILVSLMDFNAMYIFNNQAEKDINKFDEKYVEVLENPEQNEDLIIMSQVMRSQEQTLIDGVNNTDVTLSVVEYSTIEDVTKYVSKMMAIIHTESNVEDMEKTDILEFLLLHDKEAYYIFDFYPIDEDGNRIEEIEETE